jgi:hypothetical protein
MVNVRQPSLQLVIPIPNNKHALEKKLEVQIGKQEKLKSLILKHPMLTTKIHVLLLEFFLPLPIEK